MATPGELVGRAEPIARADAFRRLADQHLASSYRLARAILHDAAEAEDATHDAFVTAWHKWHTLRDVSRFERWFDRIVVNTCRNRLRDRRRTLVRDVSADLAATTPDPFDSSERRDAVGRALAGLNADQRVLVALRYYRDMTIDDIGDLLGVPAGTVKSRLHYALRQLEQLMSAAGTERAR